ncbi:hypothetical protein GCM10011386_01660 [Parapedobacter defluvii]|uniref:Uncharacterized protein n=1 Tax=Parapedobacter defluvii TaxID=2045106 RepID=A0ABQ1KWT6_9SPHI|nr:hypothetical protein GCM10011386_01660 [Parapedobacter defluvii]
MQLVNSNVYTILHTNVMNKHYLNIINGLNNILYFLEFERSQLFFPADRDT